MSKLYLQQVREMGFSDAEIANAVYKDDYMRMPDDRIYTDFETQTLYEVIDEKLYVSDILILYNGLELTLYINDNWGSIYMLFIYNSNREVKYDTYKGRKAKAYNKKTILAMLEHITTAYKEAYEKYKANRNAYDVTVEKLTKLGFTMFGTDSAYIYTDKLRIEVNIYSNGVFSIKTIDKVTKADTEEILKTLLSI